MREVRRVSARLSEEAGAGWDAFTESNGVSFSALLEATGLLIYRGKPAVHSDEVIDLARQIDRERAKRR